MVLNCDGQWWEPFQCFSNCEGQSHKAWTTSEENGELKHGIKATLSTHQAYALPFGQISSLSCRPFLFRDLSWNVSLPQLLGLVIPFSSIAFFVTKQLPSPILQLLTLLVKLFVLHHNLIVLLASLYPSGHCSEGHYNLWFINCIWLGYDHSHNWGTVAMAIKAMHW